MPPALAYAPAAEVDLHTAFVEHTRRVGLHGANQHKAARAFLNRWPDPQDWAAEPLATRLALPQVSHSFLMFLLLGGHLRPGYDYLIRRKLSSFWRDLPHGPMAADLTGFLPAAAELGFTERTRTAVGSPVVGRLLIQTGTPVEGAHRGRPRRVLGRLPARQQADGLGLPHYSRAVRTTRQVLFHLGVLDALR